jgi:hypothetical protein
MIRREAVRPQPGPGSGSAHGRIRRIAKELQLYNSNPHPYVSIAADKEGSELPAHPKVPNTLCCVVQELRVVHHGRGHWSVEGTTAGS